jgi:hypothetical protein
MRNSIVNNSFFLILFFASFFSSTKAGTLLEFDNNSLIAEISNEQIHGYYGYIHQINPFSCVFFFDAKTSNDKVKKIEGYITDSTYKLRNQDLDSTGSIFINKTGDWIIQFDHAPDPGCINVGDSFREGPDDSSPMQFTIKKRTNILGIRLVNSKRSFFYIQTDGAFSKQKRFLTASDVVVVFKEKSGFSYVRYRNPRSTRITTGWIRTQDLVNPYPD